jgi:hypothetical protein
MPRAKVETKVVETLPNGITIVESSGTFSVPKDSPIESSRGTDETFTFRARQYPSLEVALQDTDESGKNTVTAKTVLDAVNSAQRAKARSNANQSAMAKHVPSAMSPDDAWESIVRALIRQGVSEVKARATADSMRG